MKNVGVFFGSRSAEHDVSIITAQLIISGLRKLHYNVVPVYIDKKGRWLIGQELGTLKFFTNPDRQPKLKDAGSFYLDLEESLGKNSFKQKGLLGKNISVDLAFPAFHGTYGEDGTMQGVFEIFDIPYVGCDTAASAIAMDKVFTKQVCLANNIPTLEFLYFLKHEWETNRGTVLKSVGKKLRWPVMVKPAHLGSSIGLAKAINEQELEFALEVAFHYDTKVLVEKCLEDFVDLTCALLGNYDPQPSLIQESTFGKEFFSYEDKYLDEGGTQLGKALKNIHIPARLDEKTTKIIQDTAVQTFKAIGCSGIARVDFLYDKRTKKYFTSEVNPLPGTLYHHLWQKSGVELDELLSRLISLAQEKHQEKKSVSYTFTSDVLKNANSVKLQLKK